MERSLPRRGEFGGQAVAGVYEPRVEDGTHTASYFGLTLEGSWPYAVVRAESGRAYAVVRKVIGRTAVGLTIQSTGDDGLLDVVFVREGPLGRFLRSNVGRPWDTVYSEDCEHLSLDSAVKANPVGTPVSGREAGQ